MHTFAQTETFRERVCSLREQKGYYLGRERELTRGGKEMEARERQNKKEQSTWACVCKYHSGTLFSKSNKLIRTYICYHIYGCILYIYICGYEFERELRDIGRGRVRRRGAEMM